MWCPREAAIGFPLQLDRGAGVVSSEAVRTPCSRSSHPLGRVSADRAAASYSGDGVWPSLIGLSRSALGPWSRRIGARVDLVGARRRLSLYHPHQNHHARVTVAKLWVGPRETFFALNKQTRSTVQPSPYTQFVPVEESRYLSSTGRSQLPHLHLQLRVSLALL